MKRLIYAKMFSMTKFPRVIAPCRWLNAQEHGVTSALRSSAYGGSAKICLSLNVMTLKVQGLNWDRILTTWLSWLQRVLWFLSSVSISGLKPSLAKCFCTTQKSGGAERCPWLTYVYDLSPSLPCVLSVYPYHFTQVLWFCENMFSVMTAGYFTVSLFWLWHDAKEAYRIYQNLSSESLVALCSFHLSLLLH